MTQTYGSRRANCPGYLEFIWRETGAENPQAIAVITDGMSTYRKRIYSACYGIHVIEGPSVSAVKAELFTLLDSGV